MRLMLLKLHPHRDAHHAYVMHLGTKKIWKTYGRRHMMHNRPLRWWYIVIIGLLTATPHDYKALAQEYEAAEPGQGQLHDEPPVQRDPANSINTGITTDSNVQDGTFTSVVRAQQMLEQLVLQAQQLPQGPFTEHVRHALQSLPQLMQPGPEHETLPPEQLQQLVTSVQHIIQHAASQQSSEHGGEADQAPTMAMHTASGVLSRSVPQRHEPDPNPGASGPNTEDDDRASLPSISAILKDGALAAPMRQAPDDGVDDDQPPLLGSYRQARSAIETTGEGVVPEQYTNQVLVPDICQVVQKMQVCSHRANASEIVPAHGGRSLGLVQRLHMLEAHGIVCHDLDVFKTHSGLLRVGHPAEIRAFHLTHHFFGQHHSHTSSMQTEQEHQQTGSPTLDAVFPLLEDVLRSFSGIVSGKLNTSEAYASDLNLPGTTPASSLQANPASSLKANSLLASSQPAKPHGASLQATMAATPRLFLEFKGQSLHQDSWVSLSRTCQQLGLTQTVSVWCSQAQSQAILQAVRSEGLNLRAIKAFPDRHGVVRTRRPRRARLMSTSHGTTASAGAWAERQRARMRQQGNALLIETLAHMPSQAVTRMPSLGSTGSRTPLSSTSDSQITQQLQPARHQGGYGAVRQGAYTHQGDHPAATQEQYAAGYQVADSLKDLIRSQGQQPVRVGAQHPAGSQAPELAGTHMQLAGPQIQEPMRAQMHQQMGTALEMQAQSSLPARRLRQQTQIDQVTGPVHSDQVTQPVVSSQVTGHVVKGNEAAQLLPEKQPVAVFHAAAEQQGLAVSHTATEPQVVAGVQYTSKQSTTRVVAPIGQQEADELFLVTQGQQQAQQHSGHPTTLPRHTNTVTHTLQQGDEQIYDMFGPSIHAQPLQLFKAIHEAGKPMLLWTVDTPEDLAKAVRLGAAMVVSNRPVAIKQLLQTWAATCGSQGPEGLLAELPGVKYDPQQQQQQQQRRR